MDMRVRDISEELVKRFKVVCAVNGQSQNERIKKLIERDVRENLSGVLTEMQDDY